MASEAQLSPEEIAERRAKVSRMYYLLRQSTYTIAKTFGVSQVTIWRDVQHIRKQWAKQYGEKREIDPAEEVGRTIATFDEAEKAAWMEVARLNQASTAVPSPEIANAKMKAVRVAIEASRNRVTFLSELGHLRRAPLQVQHVIPADLLRSSLLEHGLISAAPQKALPPAEVIDVTPANGNGHASGLDPALAAWLEEDD